MVVAIAQIKDTVIINNPRNDFSVDENEILMLIRANKKHKNTMSLTDPVGVDKDGNDGLAEMPTHDYELFSVYTPKVYTVTFLDENGTVVSTAEYTVETSLPTPERFQVHTKSSFRYS